MSHSKQIRRRTHSWLLETPPESNIWIPFMGRIDGSGDFHEIHQHAHFTPHFVFTGSGYVETATQRYPVRAGQAFAQLPNSQLKMREDSNEPWSFFWLQVSGSAREHFASACGFSEANRVVTVANPKPLRELLEALWDLYQCPDRTVFRAMSYLWEIAHWLRDGAVSPIKYSPQPRLILDQVEQVLEATQYRANVQEICRTIGISRSHLFRLIGNEDRQSPIAFIREKRIEKAKQLLAQTSLKQATIAQLSGFQNESYFNRTFHEETGATPGAWRKQK